MTVPRAPEPLPCPFCGLEVWNRGTPSPDTRRLDWLERHGGVTSTDGKSGITYSCWGAWLTEGFDLRAAIDAAITQEGK